MRCDTEVSEVRHQRLVRGQQGKSISEVMGRMKGHPREGLWLNNYKKDGQIHSDDAVLARLTLESLGFTQDLVISDCK